MTDIRTCCFAAGLAAALGVAWAAAAAPEGYSAENSYGRGMQTYFAGNCAEAETLFSQAIGNAPRDPRPYYFRALCLLRQGRSSAAQSDFKIGAALEARAPGSYPVGKSLERVQGGDRLSLEHYRWQARTAAATDLGEESQSYSDHRATVARHTDVGALRQKISVPLDRLVQPVSLTELASVSVEVPAPAAAPPIEPTARDAASPATASTDNPFADDLQPAPGGKIPSGKLLGILGRAIIESAPVPSFEGLREQIPGLPAPTTRGDTPAAADPFGADAAVAPAADDPFGETPPSDDPAESSDQPTDAAEEDPFGGF
jgi:hypothetical protein